HNGAGEGTVLNVAILTQREESLLAAREPGYERISDFGIRHDNPGSDAVVKKHGRHWQLPGSSEEQVVGTGYIIKITTSRRVSRPYCSSRNITPRSIRNFPSRARRPS